tara:strand:+ start:304 stop:477 length:174 start_codon:yes stop_codon:yes gene_type:complete
MTLFTSLYDNLKDNERIKDLGFAILGGTISILGTRLLTGVKETQETDENYEDEIEDD